MQLKKSHAIRNKLALASSALLISSPAISIAAEKTDTADIDNVGISQLYYSEEDRVTVQKTQAIITKEIGESDILKLSFVYDTMSGASPNGRIFTDTEGGITNTTPSGSSSSGSGDSSDTWKTSFEDTRTAFNAEWEHKFMTVLTGVLGGGISKENDYESNTFSGKLLLDINQRRTTLMTGMSVAFDTVSPFGGVPGGATVLACHSNAVFRPTWFDDDCDKTENPIRYKPGEKVVNDYIIGVTQVWNRRTLMQFNFSFSKEDGYLSDPYKQVSIISSELDGEEVAVLHEKRPDTRNTKSLYYKVVHVPTDNTSIHFSYRYFWDDWGVAADTVEGRLRINLTSRTYLQMHSRLHFQGKADFFQPYVGADEKSSYYSSARPNNISADSRLSQLLTATAGVKVGVKINKSSHISARIERMTQRYKNKLLPTMKTFISQINLTFKF